MGIEMVPIRIRKAIYDVKINFIEHVTIWSEMERNLRNKITNQYPLLPVTIIIKSNYSCVWKTIYLPYLVTDLGGCLCWFNLLWLMLFLFEEKINHLLSCHMQFQKMIFLWTLVIWMCNNYYHFSLWMCINPTSWVVALNHKFFDLEHLPILDMPILLWVIVFNFHTAYHFNCNQF